MALFKLKFSRPFGVGFLIYSFLLLLLLIQISLHAYDSQSENIWIFTYLICLIILFFYRRAMPVFIMLAFFLPFFYIPKFYFDGFEISYWPSYQQADLINFISVLNSIFLLSFAVGAGAVNDRSLLSKEVIGIFNNRLLFNISLIVLFVVLYFGVQGDTIFESGLYGSGEIQKSALHEYFIVFFIISIFLKNPQSYIQTIILFILLVFYTYKTLIYGGRIEILQIWLAVLYLKYNYFFNKKMIVLLFIFFSYVIFDFISQVRENPLLILSLEDLNFLGNLFKEKTVILSSLQGDVYQSSLRVVGLFRDGAIDFTTSLLSFMSVVFFSFVPSSYMPDFYNLSNYKIDVAKSGGGGLISSFSFVWLYYFGPVLFGLFIGFFIRLFYRLNNPIINIYGLLILITFPRWFSYYPAILFRMNLLGVLLILLILFYLNINGSSKSRSLGRAG